MKKKALIKILAAPEDQEKLLGVFEHLRSSGVKISQKNDALEKKDMVLVVLTERFYQDADLKERLFDQLAAGAENILPLNLEEAPVPEEIMNLLFARNIIMASGRTDEQVAERILSAIPEKKNPMPKILAVAVAVLAVLGGLFFWRSGNQQETAPAVSVEEPVPNPLGITEEELAEIRDVVIIGDHFGYYTYDDYSEYGHWPDIHDFAYEVWQEDGGRWYSTEDGQEFTLTRYDDLRFLELMPNLSMVRMMLVDVEDAMLPDLSASEALDYVSIYNCSFTDIGWISGSNVIYLDIYGTDIASYEPLNRCQKLTKAVIDGQKITGSDLAGFAPPALFDLTLYGMEDVQDLSALNSCHSLTYLQMNGLQIRNVDFLKGLPSLRKLELQEMPSIRDISGVSELPNLQELRIFQCNSIRDYTPIHACSNLEAIQIDRWDWMDVDSSFLNGLTKLREIGLFGLNLNNMEFLKDANQSLGLNLGFCGDIKDYSGLAHVQKYQWLHVNPRSNGSWYGDFSAVAPYLENAVIAEMELYNCTNVDLSNLPKVTHGLRINRGDLEDLTGLQNTPLMYLELRDMQMLRSLEGIQGLDKLGSGIMELNIMGCIRLNDYSALDGTTIRSLQLTGMYQLPDFSRFSVTNLKMEHIEEMEDLSFLDGLNRDLRYTFSFAGMDDLKDISILQQFRGSDLCVPPQVADQAEELVKDGNFYNYRVVFPESGWNPNDGEVTLLSMEELDTLPKSVLRRVARVMIAGDEIVDPNIYEIQEDWQGDRQVPVLYNRETEEKRQIYVGSIHDFSRLSELTGLWELTLGVQPITSLEGIQNLSNLVTFQAYSCEALQDVSAVYTLQNLENLTLRWCPVDSIQGVQNLPKLCSIHIPGTYVTDISPLNDCDFSYADARGGFTVLAHDTRIMDLSPLANIPSFGHLNLCGYDPDLWINYVADARINSYCGPLGNDEMLRQFVQQHPELSDVNIERGYQISDLTPLLELPNLNYVHIWDRPEMAVRSLDGHERNFHLVVD